MWGSVIGLILGSNADGLLPRLVRACDNGRAHHAEPPGHYGPGNRGSGSGRILMFDKGHCVVSSVWSGPCLALCITLNLQQNPTSCNPVSPSEYAEQAGATEEFNYTVASKKNRKHKMLTHTTLSGACLPVKAPFTTRAHRLAVRARAYPENTKGTAGAIAGSAAAALLLVGNLYR